MKVLEITANLLKSNILYSKNGSLFQRSYRAENGDIEPR